MKRFLSLMLSLILILASSQTVLAASIVEKNSGSGELSVTSVPESTIEKTKSIFKSNSKVELTDNSLTKSQLNYEFDVYNLDKEYPEVKMTGKISLNNELYDFKATGEIDKLTIDSVTLLHGPLRGTLYVNDKQVDLVIAFQKYIDQDEIYASVSLYDSELDINSYLVFGKQIASGEFKEELKKQYQREESASLKDEKIEVPSPDMSINAVGPWINIATVNPNGMKMNLSKQTVAPTRFKLTVQSNISNIKATTGAKYAYAERVTTTLKSDGSFDIYNTSPGPSQESMNTTLLFKLLNAAFAPFNISTTSILSWIGGETVIGETKISGDMLNTVISIYDKSYFYIDANNNPNNSLPFFYGIGSASKASGSYRGVVSYMCVDVNTDIFYYTATSSFYSFVTTF